MNTILLEKRERILGWDTAYLLKNEFLLAMMPTLMKGGLKKAEDTYKKFLILTLLYPQEHPMVCISGSAYELWLLHIMYNSYEYQNDCNALFGYPLHHGKLPPEDVGRRARIQRLWHKEFCEEMPAES